MRNILGVFLLSFLIFGHSNGNADDIQFSLQLDFTVPDLDGPIQSIKFNDIDRDGFPEVLAADTNTVILYSITKDSILWFFNIDSGLYIKAILFDDVTRDSIPDLVIASEKPIYYIFPADRTYKIDLFNGAANFERSSKLYTPDDVEGNGYDRFGLLDAIDLDFDGYNELLVSFESVVANFDMMWWQVYTQGTIFLYNRFPDSLIWKNDLACAIDIDEFQATSGTRAIWPTLYYYNTYAGHGPDWSIVETWIASLTDDGNVKTTVANSADGCWDGYSEHNYNFTRFGLAGDLDISYPGVEAITIFHHIDPCYIDSVDAGFRRLQMYSVPTPDSVELLWERDIGTLDLCNFLYDPKLPGYFMAFTGNILNLLQGSDGRLRSSIVAPSGTKHWDYPFASNEPRLIALQDRLVSIYRLDITVDYNEQNNESLLPQSFTLDQNCPNPFNSATRIGFSLPKASFVTIDIFNILGQKIRTLINKKFAAGNYESIWNGKNDDGQDLSSGIYFYRLSSDQFTQTKKMILLK